MLEKVLDDDNFMSSLSLSEKTDADSTPSTCDIFDRKDRRALTTKELCPKRFENILRSNVMYSNYLVNNIEGQQTNQPISPLFMESPIKQNSHFNYQMSNPNYNCFTPQNNERKINSSYVGSSNVINNNNNNYYFNNFQTPCNYNNNPSQFNPPQQKRSQKRFNTAQVNPTLINDALMSNTSPLKPLYMRDQNMSSQDFSQFNQNLSKYGNDSFPMVMRQRKLVSDDVNSFATNEFDELLATFTRVNEKIDEEFYKHLKGKIFLILTTQNGSRVLQKCLKRTTQDILSLLLDEIKGKIHELMVDPYANYFCQKFFGLLHDKDKLIFLTNIKDNMIKVANNKIGTYPLQVVIEQLRKSDEKEILISAVRDICMDMFYDAQGVHVIEKMIICFEENCINFIYELVMNNFLNLAYNANGLCLTKKIIIHASNESTIKRIQQKIIDNCINLVQHSYGNYTVQTVFDNWEYSLTVPVIKQFFGKLSTLSMQKFSSNVVEKCLEKGGEIILSRFIDEIQYNNKIAELMKNNYGNYVVQKALKISSEANKRRIIDLVVKNLERIGEKKLIMKWRFIIQHYLNGQGNMYNQSSFENCGNINDQY
jgi:hypothetical protein